MLHRTELIIFLLALQTITIAPMMSIRGKGGTVDCDTKITHGIHAMNNVVDKLN